MGDHSDNPTPGDLFSPTKKALLESFQGKDSMIGSRVPTIQHRSPRELAPMSYAQERHWLLDQIKPGNPAYNISAAFVLDGELDIDVLEKSINEIVSRHEILRTSFGMFNGMPIQKIAPRRQVTVVEKDMSDFPDNSSIEQLHDYLDQTALRPFDLKIDPLLRVELLKLGVNRHFFIVVMHHIVSDGLSLRIFFRELAIIYAAFIQGRPSPLKDLPIQYGDYAVWQRKQIQGEKLEQQISYWKERLEGSTPTELPLTRTRPRLQTYNGKRFALSLDEGLVHRINELGIQCRATSFMTFLAAFNVLLYRYTGNEDVCVGVPIASRYSSELEELIGPFLNTLVFRLDISGNPTFLDVISKQRLVAIEAYSNQDVPFEMLVGELESERDVSRTPYFQIFFNIFDRSGSSFDLPGVTTKQILRESSQSKFDLTLYVGDSQEFFRCDFVYNRDLFDAAMIERFANHYRVVLESIVTNPDVNIDRIPLLLDREMDRFRSYWNASRHAYPDSLCIHHMIEEQVRLSPDAVAVIMDGQTITYREMNIQANKLANYLLSLGVGPEIPVGVCMERSFDLVVGILGVLKAGAAYVPLDVDYPKARLEFMVHDSQIAILLTQEMFLDRIPDFGNVKVCLDRDRHLFESMGEENPHSITGPNNLAYIIYTSGSTGHPKGILTPHRGVVNYISFMIDAYHLNSDTIALQLPSISFDPSVRDIFGTLAAGGKIVLISNKEAKNPNVIVEKIDHFRVNGILGIVPTLLRAILEVAVTRGGDFVSLRLLLVSGEILTWQDWEVATSVFHEDLLMVNQYGPTEITMIASYYPVEKNSLTTSSVPIGKPVWNVRMYILDHSLNPVPIGVTGEIYIGGVGVTRGYNALPELTAKTFIPDPFSLEAGERMYKTGDLARYLEDGDIQFLGRADRQFKIRGMRSELGEIESVLESHPSIKRGVVVVWEEEVDIQTVDIENKTLNVNIAGRVYEAPTRNRLVAYIVSAPEVTLTTEKLRNYLTHKIPDYMVPSNYVFLTELPLTPTGKVDRTNLPHPGDAIANENHYTPPRTHLEYILTDIWIGVLGIERIGVNSNFFSVGGHSLSAVRVISKINEELDVELPVRSLFEAQTIEQLAVHIETLLAGEEIPPLQDEISSMDWVEGKI